MIKLTVLSCVGSEPASRKIIAIQMNWVTALSLHNIFPIVTVAKDCGKISYIL